MSRTIRIDDEVYTWLQSRAKPFEDTPNDVLRRIAELDSNETDQKEEEEMKSGRIQNRKYSGRYLNKQWDVNAKHALYHKGGTWYNNLEKFPGALFDPYGYVVFKTEKEYQNSPYLNIGKETNVPNGISNIPEYVRMKN